MFTLDLIEKNCCYKCIILNIKGTIGCDVRTGKYPLHWGQIMTLNEDLSIFSEFNLKFKYIFSFNLKS